MKSERKAGPGGKAGEKAPPGANGCKARVDTGRRRLLSWLWRGLGASVLAETAWLLLAFVRPRKNTGATPALGVFRAGPEDRFKPGTVTAFPQGKFYLARLADGGFLALGPECTHLGCMVTWSPEKGQFLCPCHGSVFDLKGDVVTPPAPRSLDLYAVSVENRTLAVDLSKRTRRSRFEPSQAVHV